MKKAHLDILTLALASSVLTMALERQDWFVVVLCVLFIAADCRSIHEALK